MSVGKKKESMYIGYKVFRVACRTFPYAGRHLVVAADDLDGDCLGPVLDTFVVSLLQ